MLKAAELERAGDGLSEAEARPPAKGLAERYEAEWAVWLAATEAVNGGGERLQAFGGGGANAAGRSAIGGGLNRREAIFGGILGGIRRVVDLCPHAEFWLDAFEKRRPQCLQLILTFLAFSPQRFW